MDASDAAWMEKAIAEERRKWGDDLDEHPGAEGMFAGFLLPRRSKSYRVPPVPPMPFTVIGNNPFSVLELPTDDEVAEERSEHHPSAFEQVQLSHCPTAEASVLPLPDQSASESHEMLEPQRA